MIVDDDEDIRNLYKLQLSYKSYIIYLASGIDEALMITDTLDPKTRKLYIIDYILCDGTGYKLAVELAYRNINCTNILVSGNEDCDPDVHRVFIESEEHKDLFRIKLKKPIRCEMIRNAVLDCLRNHDTLPTVS